MCAVISPKVRIGCDRVRHEFVSHESQEDLKRTISGGFEADPNASVGGRMSEANDSEGGRLRRK